MKEIFRRHSFSITFLVLLFAFVFLFDDADDEIQRLSGFTMGTSFEVQIPDIPRGVRPDQIAEEIADLLNHLDREVFSTYAPDSELSRFNRHAVGTPFIASTELIEVMTLAREIAQLTSGAFDPTIGPLVNLWGFGPEINLLEASVPSDAELTSRMENIGYQHVLIDGSASQLRKTRDVTIDLSAIAKGYAVDQLALYLDELEVDSYFLEIGGELKMKGLKPSGDSWIPAIEAPLDTASQVYEIFYSRGDTIAVAGSGDYRNYFEEDGVRYSHEIDPRTGRPITHNLAATYVIDESAARADALATGYMILGLESAKSLALRNSQAAYFIYKEEQGFADDATPAFNYYLNQ